MLKEDLEINEVPYLYDQSGRVWMKNGKVYRIIDDKDQIENYRKLLESSQIEDIFSAGLISTQIVEEANSGTGLILEHERIPFILHPCEYSNEMFWRAAIMFLELNMKLWDYGFVTHDAHPWNISFIGNRPVFYDFGSLIKRKDVSRNWFDEFYRYFMVPVWLAGYSLKTNKFAKEYRREHENGFGLEFFQSAKIKHTVFRKFRKLFKYNDQPEKLFSELLKLVKKYKPIQAQPEYWSDYYKTTGLNYLQPESIKQQFVHKILSHAKPGKVLDLAANKGYFAGMAASMGSKVLAFDYEEEIVNYFLQDDFPGNNVTPAHMDFKKPTPALGPGLFWHDSFSRFGADIVLSLGLIHHICISQQVPVYLFCETCKKYAHKGIILEFVDPGDKHVSSWDTQIPKDYTIETITSFMKDKFPNCEISELEQAEGLNRTYLFFYKN